MYMHIGAGKAVRDSDIVGIFDLDGSVTPEATKNYLKSLQSSGEVTAAGDDLPKSFVVISVGNEKDSVILSHISSSKLAGRG